MADGLIHQQPCDCCAEAGRVLIDGECGLSVTMTHQAAAATAERLMTAAQHASEQEAGTRPPVE